MKSLKVLRVIIISLILCLLGSSSAFAAPLLYKFKSNYYCYVDGAYTWAEAQTAVVEMSYKKYKGHLITITTEREQEFVIGIIQDLELGSTWVGAYQDLDSEFYTEPDGGWNWVTGETWDYANWYVDIPNGAQEPNNYYGNENYAQMYGSGMWNDYGSGMWNDVPEDALLGFIVEYEKIKSNTCN